MAIEKLNYSTYAVSSRIESSLRGCISINADLEEKQAQRALFIRSSNYRSMNVGAWAKFDEESLDEFITMLIFLKRYTFEQEFRDEHFDYVNGK